MAAADLPIDGDGTCMKCKTAPPTPETLTCRTCATPWHVQCLSIPPKDYDSAATWLCPDCAPPPPIAAEVAGIGCGCAPIGGSGGLIAEIRAIEADSTLTEREKARKRQELMSGKERERGVEAEEGGGDAMKLLDEKLMCLFCREVLDRPVTVSMSIDFLMILLSLMNVNPFWIVVLLILVDLVIWLRLMSEWIRF